MSMSPSERQWAVSAGAAGLTGAGALAGYLTDEYQRWEAEAKARRQQEEFAVMEHQLTNRSPLAEIMNPIGDVVNGLAGGVYRLMGKAKDPKPEDSYPGFDADGNRQGFMAELHVSDGGNKPTEASTEMTSPFPHAGMPRWMEIQRKLARNAEDDYYAFHFNALTQGFENDDGTNEGELGSFGLGRNVFGAPTPFH